MRSLRLLRLPAVPFRLRLRCGSSLRPSAPVRPRPGLAPTLAPALSVALFGLLALLALGGAPGPARALPLGVDEVVHPEGTAATPARSGSVLAQSVQPFALDYAFAQPYGATLELRLSGAFEQTVRRSDATGGILLESRVVDVTLETLSIDGELASYPFLEYRVQLAVSQAGTGSFAIDADFLDGSGGAFAPVAAVRSADEVTHSIRPSMPGELFGTPLYEMGSSQTVSLLTDAAHHAPGPTAKVAIQTIPPGSSEIETLEAALPGFGLSAQLVPEPGVAGLLAVALGAGRGWAYRRRG